MVILKYWIPEEGTISTIENAQLLTIGKQYNKEVGEEAPCLWIEYDGKVDQKKKEVYFYQVGTGRVFDFTNMEYIGTVQCQEQGMNIVRHIYMEAGGLKRKEFDNNLPAQVDTDEIMKKIDDLNDHVKEIIKVTKESIEMLKPGVV